MLPPQLPLRPPVWALWGRSSASVRAKGSESRAAGGDHTKEQNQPFSLNVEGFKNFVSFSFFREPKGWVLKCPAVPLYPRAPGGSDLSALQPLGAGDRARLRRFAGQPSPGAADTGVSNPPSIGAPKVLLHLGQSSCFASISDAEFAARCGLASLHPMAGR